MTSKPKYSRIHDTLGHAQRDADAAKADRSLPRDGNYCPRCRQMLVSSFEDVTCPSCGWHDWDSIKGHTVPRTHRKRRPMLLRYKGASGALRDMISAYWSRSGVNARSAGVYAVCPWCRTWHEDARCENLDGGGNRWTVSCNVGHRWTVTITEEDTYWT